MVCAGCAHEARRVAASTTSQHVKPTVSTAPLPDGARSKPAAATYAPPAAPSGAYVASAQPSGTVGPLATGASNAGPGAAPAGSRIYSVHASPDVVHDGQAVVWDVRTTPDIVKVTARTSMIELPFQRFSPGHFGLTFAIPHGVPGFFHGTYTMDVSAVSAAGATLHRGIALTFL